MNDPRVKKVCRRCYGHAVSVQDVTAPTRMIRPYLVSTTGCAHKPKGERTECGLTPTDRWG